MAEIKDVVQAKKTVETLSATELQPTERVLLNLIVFIISWLESVERTAEDAKDDANAPKW